jgi:hypothetical protein
MADLPCTAVSLARETRGPGARRYSPRLISPALVRQPASQARHVRPGFGAPGTRAHTSVRIFLWIFPSTHPKPIRVRIHVGEALRWLAVTTAFGRAKWSLAAAAVLVTTACAHDEVWNTWMGPHVVPHRGSAVVTIRDSKVRTVLHHDPFAEWWSSSNAPTQDMDIVESWSRDLDPRTCKWSEKQSRATALPPDPTMVPDAERAMIGPMRYDVDASRTSLIVLNTATGKTGTGLSSLGEINPIAAVPAVRRVVVVTSKGPVIVYDIDTHQGAKCTWPSF